jgi:putative ABC transport system substrate-binding protein
MRRRTFFTLIAGAAAWPLSANAQQPKRPLIGFLSNPSREVLTEGLLLPAFHRGLADARFVEGKNVAIEYRFADGYVDRLPALAADLVNRNVDVLVTFTNPTALAAKAETTTIPIIFIIGGDPVKLGLLDSLNRPAGNATGISFFSTQLEAKRLGLLHELVPRTALMAVLTNPSQPAASAQENEVATAARALGLKVNVVHASNEAEIYTAFSNCVEMGWAGCWSPPMHCFSAGIKTSSHLQHVMPFRLSMNGVIWPWPAGWRATEAAALPMHFIRPAFTLEKVSAAPR